MATKIVINDFQHQLTHGVHNIGSDVFKLALFNVAPVSTNTVLADITQIAYTNLANGANPVITVDATAATNVTSISAVSLTLTASGGSVATFRYYAIYNDTATTPGADPLVMAWDHGSAVTLADGETFTIKFNNADVASPGTIMTLTAT